MPDPDVRANTDPATIGPGQFSGASSNYLDSQALTAGEGTVPRDLVIGTITQSNQSLRLAYFTARKAETITQVSVGSSSTAAGATPTIVRIGIYTVAANGDLALVAATANDTALLAAASTVYTKVLAAPYAKVAGQRYAAGILVVTGATAPTIVGATTALLAGMAGAAPKLGGLVAGQADLPASVVAASVSDSANRPYVVLLP